MNISKKDLWTITFVLLISIGFSFVIGVLSGRKQMEIEAVNNGHGRFKQVDSREFYWGK